MKKQNSQLEHGQPMEQIRGMFCTYASGVVLCQSQHQCHFWRMRSMFDAYCKASELDYERLQKSKDSLKDCFENVIIK